MEKPLTQAQMVQEISGEMEGLWDDVDAKRARRMVKVVLDSLSSLVVRELRTKGVGSVILPHLGVKLVVATRPKTKARIGRNPLTGEEIQIPAKPERKVIRARIMKSLKDAVL